MVAQGRVLGSLASFRYRYGAADLHAAVGSAGQMCPTSTTPADRRGCGVIYDLRGQLVHCLAAQPAVLGELERCRDS
jgi:hypothetical protein